MHTPDFNSMSLDELRLFVITHPDYKEAWKAYVERYTDSIIESMNPSLLQDSKAILKRKRQEQVERAKTMDVRQKIMDELEECEGDILLDVLSLIRLIKSRPRLD